MKKLIKPNSNLTDNLYEISNLVVKKKQSLETLNDIKKTIPKLFDITYEKKSTVTDFVHNFFSKISYSNKILEIHKDKQIAATSNFGNNKFDYLIDIPFIGEQKIIQIKSKISEESTITLEKLEYYIEHYNIYKNNKQLILDVSQQPIELQKELIYNITNNPELYSLYLNNSIIIITEKITNFSIYYLEYSNNFIQFF